MTEETSQYMYLKIEGAETDDNLDIHVKFDDEGVVIDVFDVNEEVISTPWSLYIPIVNRLQKRINDMYKELEKLKFDLKHGWTPPK